jgi:hypothetical protein
MNRPIRRCSIEEYEQMSITDLAIQEEILYSQYKLCRSVLRYKELKEISEIYT